MADTKQLEQLTRLIRRQILLATTEAGSGHPSSSLSAVELTTALMFDGHFRFDADRPERPENDRLIFSKGHASPLFYALWLAAGWVTPEQMLTYRDFDSVLEGHPSRRFPFTEAATGSLGQGLSIGVGEALAARRLDGLPYRTFVLLGDSEMAEGSVWEAMQLAAHYGLDNLTGVVDVNRLGQRGETMVGRDLDVYARRAEAFGWRAVTVEDGHDLAAVSDAYAAAAAVPDRPSLIVAGTVKGKGVPEIEDENGWHGKALDRDMLERALAAIGEVDQELRGELLLPEPAVPNRPRAASGAPPAPDYARGESVPTRDAYGNALVRLAPHRPDIVSLDGEVSNSTRAAKFAEKYPDRFLEMFIAEQNMAGAAVGLARRGHRPFVSSFAAFLTRAFDQIRMGRLADVDVVYCGSHAGVGIGEDGPSQMGLEDLAMFRSIQGSSVLYPADAVAAERLVELAADTPGTVYLRTHRQGTPVIYDADSEFRVGGCSVLRRGPQDALTIVAAGATVPEALAAHQMLAGEGVAARVIDLYSVKPLDHATLAEAAAQTGLVITVEDHVPAGGLGEAVAAAVGGRAPVHTLAVRRRPRSGTSAELLAFAKIDARAIVSAYRSVAATV